MLLRYGLGEENAAKRIEAAVIETLNRGFRTGDIFSTGTVSGVFTMSTLQFLFGDLISSKRALRSNGC